MFGGGLSASENVGDAIAIFVFEGFEHLGGVVDAVTSDVGVGAVGDVVVVVVGVGAVGLAVAVAVDLRPRRGLRAAAAGLPPA